MQGQTGQVLYTDPESAKRIEGFAWAGRAFAFVDATELAAEERAWFDARYGAAPRYTIPLVPSQAIELPGMTVSAAWLPRLGLASITSDRILYRQAADEVHLLVVDPFASGCERNLVVAHNGREYLRRSARLDGNGMATVDLVDLPAGDYAVHWADGSEDEPACEFTVAEYRLAPLVASLVDRSMYGDPPRISVILRLETFGVPVHGRVRLDLVDHGVAIDTQLVRAKAGRAYASFVLAGEGPHVINVQMLDDPSRTATVPLVGSRNEERQHVAFSRLGTVVTGSLLPSQGAKEARGIYFEKQGTESSPVRLEGAGTGTLRLTWMTEAEAVCVQLINPYCPEGPQHAPRAVVSRWGHVRAGETMRLETPAPIAFVAIGAFIDGTPWEGWAAAVASSGLRPTIHLPEEVAPGSIITVGVEVVTEEASVYLVVKDARLPANDTPVSRLAQAVKQGVAESLGDLTLRAPRPIARMRDAVTILLSEGVISRDQLLEATKRASADGADVTDALMRLQYATGDAIARALTEAWGLEFVDLDELAIPPSVVELVPESVARENTVIPIAEAEGELKIAVDRPDSYDTFDKLQFILNRRVTPVLAPREAICEAINRYYGQTVGESVDSMLQEFSDTAIDFCETAHAPQLASIAHADTEVLADAPMTALQQQPSVCPSRPADDAQVLFTGLVPVSKGRAEVRLKLGHGLIDYVAEAFVMSKQPASLDWAAAELRFRPKKDLYAELELPCFVGPGDGAQGRVHAGAGSGRFRVRVSRNGEPVPLTRDSLPVAADDVVDAPRATFDYLATAGEYEATVEDVETGQVDRSFGEVRMPGKFRWVARRLRFLEPGDRISYDERPTIHSLRVLPGLEQPFRALVEATGDYQHCCCEQTAAKILAATGMYATAADDPARRRRAEAMIVAGIRRQRSMWLPGRGFKGYPGIPDDPDRYYGPLAARYLHYVGLLREMDRGDLGVALRQTLDEAVQMAEDTTRAYGLDWPPRDPRSAVDAYAAVRFSSDRSTRAKGIQWIRTQTFDNAPRTGGDDGVMSGAVGRRTVMAYAAAALVRHGHLADLPLALCLANRVVRELGPQNRLYSTVDSVAAVALMAEIRAARIVDGGGSVVVDGQTMTTAAAAARQDVREVQAVEGSVLVEMAEELEEDWSTFASGVPLTVRLEKGGMHRSQFQSADALDLVVTVVNGYQTGDLLWVCLPDSLSRVVGGGQLKESSVDFEGRDTVRIPLVTSSLTMDATGAAAPHHFSVCLRNMFAEERIGNPGPIAITVTERKH